MSRTDVECFELDAISDDRPPAGVTVYARGPPLAEGEDFSFSDSGILTEPSALYGDDGPATSLLPGRPPASPAWGGGIDDTLADGDRTTAAQPDDMVTFAERYFNTQSAATPTRYHRALSRTVSMVKRRSAREVRDAKHLLHYTKATTMTKSLLRYLLPELVPAACYIFKNICKYMRAECKTEPETLLREIVQYGVSCVELRDEIYCQLVRQTHANPHAEGRARAWTIACLCAVSFRPSDSLRKPLLRYLKKSCDDSESEESETARCANYCLWHLRLPMDACRRLPPSVDEIQAVLNLQPLSTPVQLMDGSVVSVNFDPAETVKDVLTTIQQSLQLKNGHGWALFECTLSDDRHIKDSEHLSDIFSDWEACYGRTGLTTPGTPRSECSRDAQNYPKLVFCKHIFAAESDEVKVESAELNLLYAQAVHSVVQTDEFRCAPPTALHLAGLQAQVRLGDHDDDRADRYSVGEFLCERVAGLTATADLQLQIAAAHKKHGRGYPVAVAKQRYLTTVSQLPLYGCTRILAHYCGVWPHDYQVALAFGPTSVHILSTRDQHVICECFYAELDQVILTEEYECCHVTLELRSCARVGRQRSHMFTCLELHDVAAAIEFHAPRLARWTASGWQQEQVSTVGDWLVLHEDLLSSRRSLVRAGLTQRASNADVGGIFRLAIHRLSWRRRHRSRDQQADRVDVCGARWRFSRLAFRTSLLPFESHELKDVAARLFNSTLVYCGVESTDTLEAGDLMIVMQMLMNKCLDNTDLCNEFYLQLIKQTTDPDLDVSQKIVLAYWNLMSVVTCVALPTNRLIFRYLLLHLKRHSLYETMETSKSAQFCIQNICRSYRSSRKRIFPPSRKEISTIISRCNFNAQVHLSNGDMILAQFDSSTTASSLLRILKAKAGIRLDATGYGLFQHYSTKEYYLSPEEKIVDFIYMWEKAELENTWKDIKLSFKKRLLIEPYVTVDDPAEIDLVYHQCVTQLFEQKIHLTKPDVIELCALRAQTEYGDYQHGNLHDYTSVMRIVPCHVRQLIQPAEVAVVHKLCTGMSPLSANVAGLCILQQWPLFGATVFEVNQSDLADLPECIWLAVSQFGVHLVELKGQAIFVTYPYSDINDCTDTDDSLMVVFAAPSSYTNLTLRTTEASHIVQLVDDYREALEHSGRSTAPQTTPTRPANEITGGCLLRDCHRACSANGVPPDAPIETVEIDTTA